MVLTIVRSDACASPMHARRYVPRLADEREGGTAASSTRYWKAVSMAVRWCWVGWLTGGRSLLRVGSGMLQLSAAAICWVRWQLTGSAEWLFASACSAPWSPLFSRSSVPARPLGSLLDFWLLLLHPHHLPALCSMRYLSHLPIASP